MIYGEFFSKKIEKSDFLEHKFQNNGQIFIHKYLNFHNFPAKKIKKDVLKLLKSSNQQF